MKLQGTPQSNDALFATDEGKRLTFIEFKNAKVAKALEADEVQSTNARDFIAKSITAHANKNKNANFIKYGLESFQGYCFQHVFTYTQDEFAKRFT